MKCSVDKACYTLICLISCNRPIAFASRLAPTIDRILSEETRSNVCGLAREER